MILAVSSDSLTLRRLTSVADAAGKAVIVADSLGDAAVDRTPDALVVELERGDALEIVSAAKDRWPTIFVIGVLKIPSADLWRAGEDAGCDLVTTVGAIPRSLPSKLEKWLANPLGRRLRLFAMAEIAGRLGLVARIDDEATGPVAVYHLAGDIVAVQDLCPHAGARLSGGEVGLDDGIVTCPEHGSRFDTRSGDRLRGPADQGLVTYPVVIEDGQAYLQLNRL